MSYTSGLRMKPEGKSYRLLGVTRAKAKMLEYNVPEEYQNINLSLHPKKLFTISIGLLGELAASINRDWEDSDYLLELKANLLFSARFFDSYLQSKLDENIDPYLVLLGSASYYLCDLPGSSLVLSRHIEGVCPDLEGDGLESLLLWLLQTDLKTYFHGASGTYGEFIDEISKLFVQFFKNGNGEENLLAVTSKLRLAVYKFGTPRQLLFGDVIVAVLRKKIENSAWKALPLYSGLPREKWCHVLQKDLFIKELWPAQHLLGRANVLKGASAIVQMPTSAGKTKATELILRSAFLSERISLAIIIAPFRALCHEIRNNLVEAFQNEPTQVDELSDVLQTDFEIAEIHNDQQILVVTPEKLFYVLKHAPELADQIGLIVFDEGHQFDSGTRGITYELLLTSLRSMIPKETQKVLISAVISNAKAVGEWLNGEPNVIEGTSLIPTIRSIGFVSWLDQLGKIEYVDSRNAEQGEFFVPRVIEEINLGRRGGERKDRFFPESKSAQDIALYLGLKLVQNGSIAVFCGKKSTASSVCERAIEIIERGLPLDLPSSFSDEQEVGRIAHLHVKHLGADAPTSKCAIHGIFSHHGNTPHGIRLAVEHSMRLGLIRFVVCTSTLAQGVNLPIRYLIVSSVNHDKERIKVRDFHNLIGRAGRSGMHTEGSILFADVKIYDNRKNYNDRWRWNQVKELLDPNNTEPCISNLLSIFAPIKSDDGKHISDKDFRFFVNTYIGSPEGLSSLATSIVEQNKDKNFSIYGVEQQISWRINLISAVESFLLSHMDESGRFLSETEVARLAEGTLAFFLANDQEKDNIRVLFQLLARNISVKITDPARRKIYGKTLYGVQDAQDIDGWVQENVDSLLNSVDEKELLDVSWPLIARHIKNKVFIKCDQPDVLKEIAHSWISGEPFCTIIKILHEREVKMIHGLKQKRGFRIEDVIDICEGALAYDGTLVVSAICEFMENIGRDDTVELINRLRLFQKRLKYGLPTETTIAIYELGFADRVIAQDIATSLHLVETQKRDLVVELKRNLDIAKKLLNKYPIYFQDRMNELL